MDRNWLEQQLQAGRSIEAIARDVERHPSTVAYWARKHGLISNYAERHGARGRIDREQLVELIAGGLPVRDIAEALDRSPTTIRHWLRRYDLETAPKQRRVASAEAARAGISEMQLRCRRHGLTRHVLRSDGYRCSRCSAERVSAWRRKIKRILIQEAGGACRLCGYDRCAAALHFHHLDPSTKQFALSREGVTRSLAEARREMSRCVLLCANCHAEVESRVVELDVGSIGGSVYPA